MSDSEIKKLNERLQRIERVLPRVINFIEQLAETPGELSGEELKAQLRYLRDRLRPSPVS